MIKVIKSNYDSTQEILSIDSALKEIAIHCQMIKAESLLQVYNDLKNGKQVGTYSSVYQIVK